MSIERPPIQQNVRTAECGEFRDCRTEFCVVMRRFRMFELHNFMKSSWEWSNFNFKSRGTKCERDLKNYLDIEDSVEAGWTYDKNLGKKCLYDPGTNTDPISRFRFSKDGSFSEFVNARFCDSPESTSKINPRSWKHFLPRKLLQLWQI